MIVHSKLTTNRPLTEDELEAQSTWSINIIFRLADYYFDSAMSYLKIRKADLHSSVKVDVPDVEVFVVYLSK